MALEAGVQLFESNRSWLKISKSANRSSFRIHHQVSKEFSYSLRNARLRSKVGSNERARPSTLARCAVSARIGFHLVKWTQPAGTQSIADGHRHMSDLGLRYGEEFRPINGAAAANQQG
jgi:hypothetical protein